MVSSTKARAADSLRMYGRPSRKWFMTASPQSVRAVLRFLQIADYCDSNRLMD